MTPEHQGACEVCGQTAATRRHPCRFATGCPCWAGTPCNAIPAESARLARISALSILDAWDLARAEAIESGSAL